MTLDLGFEDPVRRGAVFSHCRKYRYRLWRIWDADQPTVVFIMLNPSTADEETNDPTVARCEERARLWGYGGLEVVNLFAWRDTSPSAMKKVALPIGEENDQHILAAVQETGRVICAWGNHGTHLGRSAAVRGMLACAGVPLYTLKIAKTGEPYHPLYLPYSLQPVLWDGH